MVPMAIEHVPPSAKRQVRNLLLVFFSAILFGFIVAIFSVYNYGPSGRYLAPNALLSPDLISSLSYNDTNSKTGGKSRFVFDGFEFTHYDAKDKKNKHKQPELDQYAAFYKSIMNDSSMQKVPDSVIALFNNPATATLSINVRTEGHTEWQNDQKAFEQVDFSPDGDYYRIRLHEAISPDQWIYFNHPGIYKEVMKIFESQS